MSSLFCLFVCLLIVSDLIIGSFSISFERSSRTRATRSDTKSFKICGDSETLQTYAPAIAAMLKSTFGDNCIDVEGDYNFLGFQSLSTLFYRPSIEHNHDNGCDALQKYVDRYNDQDGGEFFSTFVFLFSEKNFFRGFS